MPPKPTNTDIDADLGMFERDIRQLKIEYEQYFGGGKKKPPTEIEWRLETLMKRYSDRGADMNYGQRFRYGNLVQMYSKFRDIFRKRMKAKEEGTVQRHFGAAAREIEKQRAAKQAAAAKPHAAPHFPFTVSCKDPDQESEKSRGVVRGVPRREGKDRRKVRRLVQGGVSGIRPQEDRSDQEANQRRRSRIHRLAGRHACKAESAARSR